MTFRPEQFLPDPWASTGIAYDGAFTRDDLDELDDEDRQEDQTDEFGPPIEHARSDDMLDVLRSILEESNIDPVLVDQACDRVRKVVADHRRGIRKSYDRRSRLVDDGPPDLKGRPEVGKGPAEDAALAEARKNIGRLDGGPMAYLPSSHRPHTPSLRQQPVAMDAASRPGFFSRFPDEARIKLL